MQYRIYMSMSMKKTEIWLADLEPAKGSEIKKIRPVLIISGDISVLPIKICVPITGWQQHFERNFWHLKIIPNIENGLQKDSALDLYQIRTLDVSRFKRKLGKIEIGFFQKIFDTMDLIFERNNC